jgi:hypothetical protein
MGLRKLLGIYEHGEAPRPSELTAAYGSRQLEMSRRMGDLVDVVYALVLVEGARAYHEVFTIPGEFSDPSRWLPVGTALALIYFTAVQSFVDFHLGAEDQPFQLLRRTGRGRDLLRFYIDIVAVGLYSFLLLKCHVLIASPDANIVWAFAAFPVIFALYIIWGELRKCTSRSSAQSYSVDLLLVVLYAYLALIGLYLLLPRTWGTNAACLGIAMALMLSYRWLNWSQNRTNANPGD